MQYGEQIVWRLIRAAVCLAVFTGVLLDPRAGGVPLAHACNAGRDFNPVAQSDLIVSGRIVSWEEVGVGFARGFVSIKVTIEVDRVLKGSSASRVEVVDNASLTIARKPDGSQIWQGGNSCGTFWEDPTGKQIIGAFHKDEAGVYRSASLTTFLLAHNPSTSNYQAAYDRLARFGLTLRPPATGDGGLVPASLTP